MIAGDEDKALDDLLDDLLELKATVGDRDRELRKIVAGLTGIAEQAVDLDDAWTECKSRIERLNELETWHETWHDALHEAGIDEPAQLAHFTASELEFVDTLRAELACEGSPIDALLLALGRGADAIFPNSYHWTAKIFARELAVL